MTRANLKRVLGEQRHHFNAFFVLGDPEPELSVELICAAARAGATMLELGLPFSDPGADGPALQAACRRAREGGTSTDEAFGLLARIHDRLPDVPKNLLVYGNLVHARGYDTFCKDAAAAGASSLLVPDIPLEEADQLLEACQANDVASVLLAGPRTSEERLERLDAAATGFIYLTAYQGITGTGAAERQMAPIARVAATVRHAICLGFGLSSPDDLRDAFLAGARIAVVGSGLARRIAAGLERNLAQPALLESIFDVCQDLARVPKEMAHKKRDPS